GVCGGLHTGEDTDRGQNLRSLRLFGRAGPDGRPRPPDVVVDRRDELRLGAEGRLVAEALPQLEDEALPVQVALEVEDERLDAPFGPAEVRIRPDRDRGAMTERRTGVDPELRHEQIPRHREVRGGEAERDTALVAV